MMHLCVSANVELTILLVVFLHAFTGCTRSAENSSENRPYLCWDDIRNGDLLFRMGRGASSHVVVTVGGGHYSHIGIAKVTDEGVYVIHAVPGEGDEDVGADIVRCDAIDVFYSEDRASAGAAARVGCSDTVACQALTSAYEKFMDSVPFDHKYDLTDTTALYCTELIWLAYRKCGIDLADERRHELVIPGHTLKLIFPEDIWNSRYLSVFHEFAR